MTDPEFPPYSWRDWIAGALVLIPLAVMLGDQLYKAVLSIWR